MVLASRYRSLHSVSRQNQASSLVSLRAKARNVEFTGGVGRISGKSPVIVADGTAETEVNGKSPVIFRRMGWKSRITPKITGLFPLSGAIARVAGKLAGLFPLIAGGHVFVKHHLIWITRRHE